MYLFEVSWEVCNKVGAIHSVLRTKAAEAVREFGDDYFLFGPWLNENPDFQETSDSVFDTIRGPLEEAGLRCRLGRWNIPGEPRVILVEFHDRYDVNKLLYGYWRDFGLDSYSGRWDYMEPILFSTACGEAIEVLYRTFGNSGNQYVAHLHEWLSGGALLHLKKKLPEIGLVFTTHATTLGRCMSGFGRDIHLELDHVNALEEARTYGVSAKHFMETVAAREADCFTTVSDVTADEAASLLGRRPDFIVECGLRTSDYPDVLADEADTKEKREYLLHFSRHFLEKDLPASTRFWLTSGRYEFFNKGYDVFLEALAKLDERLRGQADAPPVVAFFLITSGHRGVQEAAFRRIHQEAPWSGNGGAIVTHHLHDDANDAIVKTCQRLGLKNSPENKVHIIFSPAFLDGHDGIFQRSYHEVLAGCNLGVFPSFYQPWGYTPLEAVAHGVPTITSDLTGFGSWAVALGAAEQQGVSIIPRKGQPRDNVVGALASLLGKHLTLTEKESNVFRRSARDLAVEADWSRFFGKYLSAYKAAAEKSSGGYESTGTIAFRGYQHSDEPRFRSFSVVSATPEKLEGLDKIARNLWWSWSPAARELFAELDEQHWLESDNNPIMLLNNLPKRVLEEKAKDKAFVSRYKKVVEEFDQYMEDREFLLPESTAISREHPVAYFSMEFALHECLPVYSGGLGVLSGDHLKSASDLNIPLIGVGLFYRNGYFTQLIDSDGHQREEYPELDCSKLPISAVLDDEGNEARISVQYPGRLIHARIWKVQVGRVELYLLDSDVEENEPGDRWLTSRLYGGDRRNRVKQEVLVGIGGVRFIRDVLKMKPSVYHMNEGHCAFLVLERIKDLMANGLSYLEAREAVRAGSVFTTHTPVPAGNETFELEVVEHYLRDYVTGEIGIEWERFLELGHDTSKGTHQQEFSMTVLALKVSSRANGVAKLHGQVSRSMWQHLWKGVNLSEVPIFAITNGIHLQTWTSKTMRALLSQYTSLSWGKNEANPESWEGVQTIPDEELWQARLEQKRGFIRRLKRKIEEDYTRRGENPDLLRTTLEALQPESLIIGFARRFATYKRATLFLRNWDRLQQVIGNPDRPVVMLFAGKAHPADVAGKEFIREIIHASRSEQFRGKVIFLENYNMGLGRLLYRGVDVWLNNPKRPNEASGTSGMKLCANGGLNLSILDGWWDEGYTTEVGWKIGSHKEYNNPDQQDELDSRSLLEVLESQVIPLYFARNAQGFSSGWMQMVKSSMQQLSPYFNTSRMVGDYYSKSYLPTADRELLLQENDYLNIKELASWKKMISNRFTSVEISKVEVKGIRNDQIAEMGSVLEANVFVDPGKLSTDEIQTEFVVFRREGERFVGSPIVLQCEPQKKLPDSGVIHYTLKHTVEEAGSYAYAVRVVPVHPLLSSPQETGLICWG